MRRSPTVSTESCDPPHASAPGPGAGVAGDVAGHRTPGRTTVALFTFSQLTPTAFLERSARVYPDRTAVIDGDRRFTYREFADRARRLAGALAARGIAPGDRVAA